MTNEPRTGDYFFPRSHSAPFEFLVCVHGIDKNGPNVSQTRWAAPAPLDDQVEGWMARGSGWLFKAVDHIWFGLPGPDGKHKILDIEGKEIEGVILPDGYTPMLTEHVMQTVMLLESLPPSKRWNPLHHYLGKDRAAWDPSLYEWYQ
jgi:hypothetical protein